jgi:TetR/AcrR family transcriptional regulator, cholesterol catabolism regulator
MTVSKRDGTTSRKRGHYAPDVTRKQLLSAALKLFSEKGFHSTTVEAIVVQANVTKGAFYHHFESKEDLLRQIHAEYASEMLAGAREVKAAQDLEPIDQLRSLIERAVILLGRYREHVAVFYQELRFLSGKNYAAIRRMHEEQEAILLDVVERAKKAGQLRPEVDSKLLLFSISGTTAWIYQWYRPDGKLGLEAIARALADIILFGAMTPEYQLAGSGQRPTAASAGDE